MCRLNRIAKAEADERWLVVMRGVVALALQANTAVMAVQHKQTRVDYSGS